MKASRYCIAFGCLNKDSDRSIRFHKLPRDIERRRNWLISVGREDLLQRENLNSSGYWVCSAHFDESSVRIVKHLKEDAVPTLKLPHGTQESLSSEAAVSVKTEENPEILLNESGLKAPSTSTQIKEPSCLCQTVLLQKKIKTFSVQTQTEDQTPYLKEQQTQTAKSLTENTPRKRKLADNLKESKLKRP